MKTIINKIELLYFYYIFIYYIVIYLINLFLIKSIKTEFYIIN